MAFLPDGTQSDAESRVDEIIKKTEEAGYSVSAGYSYSKAEDLDMDRLIKQAEEGMYRSKAEYYKTHDRR